MTVHSGTCRCDQVSVTLHGAPLRVGICHCTDCRQESRRREPWLRPVDGAVQYDEDRK